MKETIEQSRMRTLDVLKGVCIVLVILTHFKWSKDERLLLLFPFWVEMAVPIFMIVSGYVYAWSYERKQIKSVKETYCLCNIVNRLSRFVIPFTMIFLFEILYKYVVNKSNIQLSRVFILYMTGAEGPGGYYVPIMIQFVFVFPFIWYVIKEYDIKGLNLCFAINFLYELFQRVYGLNEECYRLLMFRYIFVIAFGCYLLTGQKKIKKIYSILTCSVGIFFVFLFNYTNYSPIIMRYWTGTCCLCCLLVVPFSQFIICKLDIKFSPLEILGKASFNIFLIQRVFYTYFVEKIYTQVENRWGQLGICIIVCIMFGLVFYYIERPITKAITQKIIKCFDTTVSCSKKVQK